MLLNLAKLFNAHCQTRYTFELTRHFCSLKENIAGQRSAKEEEEYLKVEANLFDQSSIKHEPVSAEEVLRRNKKQKPFKPAHGDSIQKFLKGNSARVSKPIHQPTVNVTKTTRVERESESRVINDQELGFEYIRLSLGDPRMSTMLITARSKKRRDKDRQIIVEGKRLILEAFACGLKLKTIIFSQKDQIGDIKEKVAEALKINKYSTIYKVPQHDLKTWSSLVTPPGIMAVFERPDIQIILDQISANNVQPMPITVVCDNIREPNNLGSIIRTCAALPCFQIVLTKGCCDPWDSKALRGGCGGHFRVPIRDDVEWEDIVLTIPHDLANDCCVFLAENNLNKIQNQTNVIDYSTVMLTGAHNIVVIGGETHGIGEEAYRFMGTVGDKGKCLNIPLAEGIDSLNVASALTLILYELRKTLLKKQNT